MKKKSINLTLYFTLSLIVLCLMGLLCTVEVKAEDVDSATTMQTVPESITIDPTTIYLTTIEGVGNTNELSVTLKAYPEGASLEGVVLQTDSSQIAEVGANNMISAVNPGQTVLTATLNGQELGTAYIVVSNTPLICTGIDYNTPRNLSPDFFNYRVTVEDNPALAGNVQPQNVTFYAWSTDDQSDINAKVMQPVPQSPGNFEITEIPINDNEVNNFFINADHIHINIYASGEANETGDLILNSLYNWLDNERGTDYWVYYIGYEQDIGFLKPTDVDGEQAGQTGLNLQLEGLRVSSNLEGVKILTDVHMQNIGWYSETVGNGAYIEDGSYAGTMFENRQIEAVRFRLEGINASKYDIQVRAHVEDIGWQMSVLGNGAIAGTTGQNKQLEALEIRLIEK